LFGGPAEAFDPTPHHAVYALALDTAKGTSGVVGAEGTLDYRWGETCRDWTVNQKLTLTVQYAQGGEETTRQDFATTESKDGKNYLFNEKQWRNGQIDAVLRGDAALTGPNHSGVAHFLQPQKKTFKLAAGTLFPTEHTLTLIRQAESGKRFFGAHVFDGSTFDGPSSVSAVLEPQGLASRVSDTAQTAAGVNSPLIQRPFWQTWLAFYSDATKDTDADYQLGMRLYDDGVSTGMILDYGNYTIAAQLVAIEPLPKPNC
jgi:hypothetical protein